MLGGGTLSSRLGNRIRQKEGLSYGVTSTAHRLAARPGGDASSSTPSPTRSNIDRVEKAVMEELTDFLTNGPSAEEVADAKKAYLEAQKVGRTGDAALAGQIVTNLQLGRTFAHTSDMEKRIAALTPDDVKDGVPQVHRPEEAGHHPGGRLQEVMVGFPSLKRERGVTPLLTCASGSRLRQLLHSRLDTRPFLWRHAVIPVRPDHARDLATASSLTLPTRTEKSRLAESFILSAKPADSTFWESAHRSPARTVLPFTPAATGEATPCRIVPGIKHGPRFASFGLLPPSRPLAPSPPRP